MANRTVTLRELDISVLLDAALVQRNTLQGWSGLLNCTEAERELYRLKIAGLSEAREALLEQVVP